MIASPSPVPLKRRVVGAVGLSGRPGRPSELGALPIPMPVSATEQQLERHHAGRRGTPGPCSVELRALESRLAEDLAGRSGSLRHTAGSSGVRDGD